MFGIVNDFTPAEYARVRNEGRWGENKKIRLCVLFEYRMYVRTNAHVGLKKNHLFFKYILYVLQDVLVSIFRMSFCPVAYQRAMLRLECQYNALSFVQFLHQ